MLQVLCESSWFVGTGIVRGCKGMGDIPGVQGVLGGSVCSWGHKTRLVQELRPKV